MTARAAHGGTTRLGHGRWWPILSAVLLITSTILTNSVSGAQQTPEPSTDDTGATNPPTQLEISSVSPWVTSDGEFLVRFKPSAAIPADAQLTYTIHQSLVADRQSSVREKVQGIIDGGSTGKILQVPITEPFSTYGDPAEGAQVSIPIRSGRSSDRTRVFLPNPGIHPVDLVLTTAAGPELWSQVVFINRLPENYDSADVDSGARQHVSVSLVVPIQTATALDAAGSVKFSIEDRGSLEAGSSLLNAVPGAPLFLGLRPDTLQGVIDSHEPWSESLLSSLGLATDKTKSVDNKGGGSSVLRLPYAHVDTTALIQAGGENVMRQQLDLGTGVLAGVSNADPVTGTWAMDDSVTSAALPFIRSVGFDSLVVPSARLDYDNKVTEDALMTGPAELIGSGGMRVMAYDSLLSQQLMDLEVAPSIRAHQAVAVMMSEWFVADGARAKVRSPGSVILVPPTVEPATISALAAAVGGTGPLRASTGPSMLPPPTADDTEPSISLKPRQAPDMSLFLAAAGETTRQIGALETMSGGAEPDLPLWVHLNAETLESSMSTEQRLARHDSVRQSIAEKIGAVVPPLGRRVVLTGRSNEIPLRFRNDLPYDVHLVLEARSPRLEIIGGGTREILLVHGENRVNLPVKVRAPGESLLRVRLATPDDALPVASVEIPVQSTAISGVGAALSGASLLFLLVWWIRTGRRRRRQDALSVTRHPAIDPPTTGSVVDGG